jgi:hypothetical protein
MSSPHNAEIPVISTVERIVDANKLVDELLLKHQQAQYLLSVANSNVTSTDDNINQLEPIVDEIIKRVKPKNPIYRNAMGKLNAATALYIQQCLLRAEAADHAKSVSLQLSAARRALESLKQRED